MRTPSSRSWYSPDFPGTSRSRSPASEPCQAGGTGGSPGLCPFAPLPESLSLPSLTQHHSPSLDLSSTLQAAMISLCTQGPGPAPALHSPASWPLSGHRLTSSTSSLRSGTRAGILKSSNIQKPVQWLAYRGHSCFVFRGNEWTDPVHQADGRDVRNADVRGVLSCCWQSKKNTCYMVRFQPGYYFSQLY